MKYKLLIMDIDGTIITEKSRISNYLKKVVAEVQKRGILVTLTTGRMFRTTLPFAHDLNITLPIICYQGAFIKNPLNKELIFHEPIPLDLAKKIIQVAKKECIHLNVYINDTLYMTKPVTPEAREYLRVEKMNRNWKFHNIDLSNYHLKQSPTKFIMISKKRKIDRIEKEIQRNFKKQIETTRGFRDFLDVLNIGISKGKGLKILADYLKINKKEIFSIGDYYNDIPIFKESGFSVAMKNSPLKVKKSASYITALAENDGAAKAIERFLL